MSYCSVDLIGTVTFLKDLHTAVKLAMREDEKNNKDQMYIQL